MQDNELYQQILGLISPWCASDVEPDLRALEVRVKFNHPRGAKFCCPGCDAQLECHDHTEERRWRHLAPCRFKTILIARIPRVKCPEHGVKNANGPWAEKHSRFTFMFERFAIDVLLATQTVKGAMGILGAKWDQTWNIIWRAVRRGKQRKRAMTMPRIGVDEKSFKKRHSYITLLYDLDNGTVGAISERNDADAAKACLSELSGDQIEAVQTIAMDMSAANVKAAKETIPLAEHKIVHDRFHLMQLVTKAVDKVRRSEHNKLKSEADNRLTHSRYLWLESQENLTENQ